MSQSRDRPGLHRLERAALTVRHGGAVLRGVDFTDGTIDFDIREGAG